MKFGSGTPNSSNKPSPGAGWHQVGFFIVNKCLPVGVFSILTGMFWVGDHGLYPKLYYWLLMLPALLLMVVCPRDISGLLGSRIFLAFVPFACYMGVTVAWSASDASVLDLLKRPLLVMLLFYAVFEFGRRRFSLLVTTVEWSAVVSVVAAVYTMLRFIAAGDGDRLAGYGALSNPLLVSHVFGFFFALWTGIYFHERKLFEPRSLSAILILVALLLATGSRTPLVATVVTTIWLAMLTAGRKGGIALGVLAVASALILLFAPEVITQRGLSYRTDIWADVVQQIKERLWFGHGFATPLRVQVEGIPYPLHDPHNLTLSVLFSGGVVGGLLWLVLYVAALVESWRFRSHKWVLVFSATVVYGLAAGMTEGGSMLSRPKEHWFLVWIPMALIAVTTFMARADERAD